MPNDIKLPPHPDGSWPVLEPGWVWLVGAGPGDPGLITLHAYSALRQADIVVSDALVSPAILDWMRPDADLVPAGKRGGRPSPAQRDISLSLIELARAGRRVLRLKGGDPFMFGRGGEEALALVRAGVPFRVTPGITAGVGGLAYAGAPATHRDVNQTITFLTGHDKTGDAPTEVNWPAIAQGSQVIVIYMGLKQLGRISAELIAGGRAGEEPVLIVEQATTPQQRVVETTLADMEAAAEAAGVATPAVICIGRAALLRQALDWIGQAAGEAPRSLDPLGAGLSGSPS